MNYIVELQKALDYIENNLEEDINYEKIAKELGLSSFYFHRIFSSIIGISPAEYIRNRRLTCAADELSVHKANILDVAIKYGFNSNENFTRAFTKFHEITPKMAKVDGSKLKVFSKVQLSLNLNGGKIMNYRIENKEAFKICAIVRDFSIETKDEIPKFWDEVRENGKLKEISKNFSRCTLGVCIGENNANQHKYGIGIEMKKDDEQIPGTEIINVSKSKWVVFKCKGNQAKDINELWSRIYKEYFTTSEYKQKFNIDFELYTDEDTEIWIPIEK
ncbi:MAG: AraC family transcriptional regulator [Clostridia bacterium]|nr:AraC family transcriptional regulator [Clostridia bacterium]